MAMGRYTEAGATLEAASRLRQGLLRPDHPGRIRELEARAALAEIQGDDVAAAQWYRSAAERRRLVGASRPLALALESLAEVLERAGRDTEAEPLVAEALVLRRKALPAAHSLLAASLGYLARLRSKLGRPDEAEPLLREAVEVRRRAGNPAGLALALVTRARHHAASSQPDRARPLYEEALSLRGAMKPLARRMLSRAEREYAALVAGDFPGFAGGPPAAARGASEGPMA